MEPWIFAAAMLAVAGLAVAALVREPWERRPPGWRAAVAVLLAFAAFRFGALMAGSTSTRVLSVGATAFPAANRPFAWGSWTEPPDPPLLLNALFLPLLLFGFAFLRRLLPALLLALLLLVGQFFLSHWWRVLGTSSDYTSMRDYPFVANPATGLMDFNDHRLWTWGNSVLGTPWSRTSRPYPEGWLEDSGIFEDFPESKAVLGGASTLHLQFPAWRPYTPLTDLRALEPATFSLWYPGGKLSEGIHGVGYRQRQLPP